MICLFLYVGVYFEEVLVILILDLLLSVIWIIVILVQLSYTDSVILVVVLIVIYGIVLGYLGICLYEFFVFIVCGLGSFRWRRGGFRV